MHVAKTGLNAQQTRMQVIANNLANVNTTGFKRDRANFETLTRFAVQQVKKHLLILICLQLLLLEQVHGSSIPRR
jgi:flagellar basal-body rod protein FlgB